jgi:exosortase/archaeosortase family protein
VILSPLAHWSTKINLDLKSEDTSDTKDKPDYLEFMSTSIKNIVSRIVTWSKKNQMVVRFLAILAICILPALIFEMVARNNQGLRLTIGNSHIVYILSKWLVDATKAFLVLLGYHPVSEFSRTFYAYNLFLLRIDGGGFVFIGVPCLGLGLIFTYIVLIIAFPGKLKSKLIFIPLGVFFIICLNILRISFLTLMLYRYPSPEELAQTWAGFIATYHHPIFNYGVLLIIFLIFMIWVKHFSGYADSPPSPS